MSYTGQLLGIEPKVFAEIAKTDKYFVPAESTYDLPKVPLKTVRKFVRRDADTAMPVTQDNPIIRTRIQSNGPIILDFRRAKIIATISVAVDAPWSARPAALIHNIVDRFRLEQGGQNVEDRRFFGSQETLVYTTQTHINQQVTTGVALYGDGSQATRNARAAGCLGSIPIKSNSCCDLLVNMGLRSID